jgi:hypothetical protein
MLAGWRGKCSTELVEHGPFPYFLSRLFLFFLGGETVYFFFGFDTILLNSTLASWSHFLLPVPYTLLNQRLLPSEITHTNLPCHCLCAKTV